MKKLIVFCLAVFYLQSMVGQSSGIELLIGSRVDTADVDVRAVIDLYENYYRSTPDSIYDNPFWNEREKALYRDFDFSRSSIFQGGMDAENLFRYFSPFVMSVESIGEKYQIRVLFSSSTTDPAYAGSKVWCIQKLNAVEENGNWVLENLMVEISKDWSSRTVGFIEYIFPSHIEFDEERAAHADTFCREIVNRFNPDYTETFKFFLTGSVDDMGLLQNFDYYFVGVTTGKAREGMILTAKGDPFYPHEFVHKLIPNNPNRGHLIEEGLAVYLGTRQDTSEYRDLMQNLANDLVESSGEINFESVVSQEVRYNGYQTAYPAGAGICELVYKHSGDSGLSSLMSANTSTYSAIIDALTAITGQTGKEIETAWFEIFAIYR